MHLYVDRLTVFGSSLPIRYEWLSSTDRDFVVKMFADRVNLFRSKKEYENNQFDYGELAFDGERDMAPAVWRRQIVRYFVWMIAAKRVNFMVAELNVAIQGVLLRVPHNVFLGSVYAGLNGRVRLSEVLAWNNADTDEHPEVALYSSRATMK